MNERSAVFPLTNCVIDAWINKFIQKKNSKPDPGKRSSHLYYAPKCAPVSLLSYCTYFPDFKHRFHHLHFKSLHSKLRSKRQRLLLFSALFSTYVLLLILPSSRLLGLSFVATYQAMTVSLSSLFPSLPTSALWHLTLIYLSGI